MRRDPAVVWFNRAVATLIFAANVFFVPFTVRLARTQELGLLVSLSVNLLVITAAMAWTGKFGGSVKLMVFNVLGLAWSAVWLAFIFATPRMD